MRGGGAQEGECRAASVVEVEAAGGLATRTAAGALPSAASCTAIERDRSGRPAIVDAGGSEEVAHACARVRRLALSCACVRPCAGAVAQYYDAQWLSLRTAVYRLAENLKQPGFT